MTSLGLEYHNSRWSAGGIGDEGIPQLFCDGESLESLRALLPDQSWDAVTLALPFSILREEPQQAVSLQKEVERTFSGANICVIPRAIAASLAELWLRSPPNQNSLPLIEGEHLLVCSFDDESSTLSIVQRGPEELPLIVTKEYSFPFSIRRVAHALIEALGKAGQPVNGVPVETLIGLRRNISRYLRLAVPGRRIPSAKAKWTNKQGANVETILSAELYLDTLELIFAECLQQLTEFLKENPLELKAVVICGAGADTFGVQQNIIEPALTQAIKIDLGSLIRQESSSLPQGDLVIAGATLLAAGQVPFRQNLPYSVGVKMKVEPNGALADLLQLPRDTTDFWISPLLSQGKSLPTRFCSENMGLHSVLAEGEALDWTLFLDNTKSQVEKHESLNLISKNPTVINWEVSADSLGALHSIFKDADFQQVEALTNAWPSLSSPGHKSTTLPIISPDQLKSLLGAQ